MNTRMNISDSYVCLSMRLKYILTFCLALLLITPQVNADDYYLMQKSSSDDNDKGTLLGTMINRGDGIYYYSVDLTATNSTAYFYVTTDTGSDKCSSVDYLCNNFTISDSFGVVYLYSSSCSNRGSDCPKITLDQTGTYCFEFRSSNNNFRCFKPNSGYYLMHNTESGSKGSSVGEMSYDGATGALKQDWTTNAHDGTVHYFYVTTNTASTASTSCDYLNNEDGKNLTAGGGWRRLWKYGTSNYDHMQEVTLSSSSAGTYTFYFLNYGADGIGGDGAIKYTFTAAADPTPSLTFSPASGSVIKNNGIDLTVTTANISDGTTITYKRGEYTIGTATVSSNAATYRFTPTTEGEYTITASCTIDDTEYSDDFTLTVTGAPVYGVKTNFIDGGNCVKRMDYDESSGTYTYSGAKAGSDTYTQLYRCDSGDCTDCNTGWTYICEWNSLLSGTTNGDMINFTYDPSKAQASAMTITAQQTPVTIRFDNTKGWGDVYLYVWKANGSDQTPLGSWPGVKLTMDEEGYYGYTFDGDNIGLHTINNAIFNNGATEEADIRQTSDVSGTRGIQCYTINSGNRSGYAIDNKGKMGYTASQNDCSAVEPELAAAYTVNDAATIATVTLTTTPPPAASTGASFAYSVRKTGETNWTSIEGSTATTTWTTEEDDWFEFRVVISKDGKTWTQTATLNIRRKIIVRVKAFDSFEQYGMQLKYWTNSDNDPSDYVEGTAAQLTQVGTSKWYEITIKGRNRIYFIVKGNGCTTSWEGDCNGWKRSVVVGPIEDDICIEITDDYESGTNYKKYSVNSECGLFYRYQSVSTEGTYYSNYFETANTPVSMYVGSNDATRTISFQNYDVNTSQWVSHAVTTSFSGKSRGVYQAVCTSLTTGALSDVAAYTGNYYIRTDIADGGWTNYRQLANQFFYFAPNSNFPTEPYNHYWCGIANQWDNVKAEVGNTINPCLAQTLSDYNITQAASMRFEYNPETNYFNRHFIKLTTGGNDYLNIYGATASDPVYKPDTDTQLQSNTDASNMRLSDMGNWVYKLDVEVRKAAASDVKVVLRAMYPIDANGVGQGSDVANYLLGTDGSGNPTARTILGSASTNGTYTLKLIYDYKTNRLMSLYSPTDTISSDLTINADLMMLRTDDDTAQTIVLSSGGKVSGLTEIYSVLKITKSAYVRDRLGTRNYYYWFSLPYDCYLTDIFGMEDYGDKWTIQRYRGDQRAKGGYKEEWQTFWAEMNLTPTAKIEANRGYVVRIRLKESDFLIGDAGEYNRFLYFPSRATDNSSITIESLTDSKQTRVGAHTCNIEGRKQKDSHWNIVGIPGFQPMSLATTSAPVSLEDALLNHPNFYYDWSFTGGEGIYTVHAIQSSDRFLPMQAYMMQYYGYLEWNPITGNSTIKQAPRRAVEEDSTDDLIELAIVGNNRTDHTYLRLREGATAGWDINTDLCKDLSSSLAIYSIGEEVEMAGNCISPTMTQIPIGVKTADEGDYTFSLPTALQNKSVMLYDSAEEVETLLDYNDYTVRLNRGTHNKRFTIQLTEKKELIPTADTSISANKNINIDLINNKLYLHSSTDAFVIVCTVLGQTVYSGSTMAAKGISVDSGNIYIIHTQDQTYKVMIH